MLATVSNQMGIEALFYYYSYTLSCYLTKIYKVSDVFYATTPLRLAMAPILKNPHIQQLTDSAVYM